MKTLDRRHVLGLYGEQVAADFLVRSGFQILERNFRTRFGEIDIICEDEDSLVFVEVKTRNSGSHLAGLEAIDNAKLERIRATITQFKKAHPQHRKPPRIDAVSVSVAGATVKIEHLRQVA